MYRHIDRATSDVQAHEPLSADVQAATLMSLSALPETFAVLFQKWCMANLKTLSIKSATEYLTNILFKDVSPTLFSSWNIRFPISPSTAYTWMLRVGCERGHAQAGYYTDRHEAPDVVAYRQEYVRRSIKREFRMPLWVQLTAHDATELRQRMKNDGGKLPEGHAFTAHDGSEMVEFHVDDSEAFLDLRDTFVMGGNLSVRFPAGEKPLIAMGQDESIYKAFQFPKGAWKCMGVSTIRPKTEGAGLMVSAFVDCARGFGLPMSTEELETVNAARRGQKYASEDSAIALLGTADKPPLETSPGIRFLNYGINKDGYWDYDHMARQMEDVLDCAEVVYGDPASDSVVDAKAKAPQGINVDWSTGFRTMQEMDWSSGHGRRKPDGLDANRMNEKFGGKQQVMRSTVVSAEDLGPHPAVHQGAPQSASRRLGRGGGTKRASGAMPSGTDLKLKPGETQRMVFGEGDLPPFYALDTLKYDSEAPKKAKKKKGDDASTAAAAVMPGYVGKQKGLRQVLWERGWLDPRKKYTMKGVAVAGVINERSSLISLMASCVDFRNERTLMEELILDRGHVFDKSPKCHPEVRGWSKRKSPGSI